MAMDETIKKIEELESEAKKIENEIQTLINNADVENNPPSQIQISFGGVIPTIDGEEEYPHAFSTLPAINKWKPLPSNLKVQQSILVRKYQKWYNHSYNLVHEFASYREEEFKKYCEKSSSYSGILCTLNLENEFTGPVDKQKLLDSVINDFVAQQEILSAIKVTLLIHKSNEQRSEPQSILDFLQSRVRSAVLKKKPECEKDIQDVVEQLLIGRGLTKGSDYDREVGRVKVSAKEVIPDFIFPKFGLALEIKFLKNSSQRSNLIDQINADIHAYGKSYAMLAFLVYDLGHIRDEVEFKHDLENQKNVFILIVKH